MHRLPPRHDPSKIAASPRVLAWHLAGTLALSFLCTALPTAAQEQGAEATPVEELERGVSYTRESGPGVTHGWRLALESGQFAHVRIAQSGANVEARIKDPGGGIRLAIDDGARIPEHVEWVADTTGMWSVEVVGNQFLSDGAYVIEWIASRPASESDRKLFQSDSLVALAWTRLNQREHAEAEALFRGALAIQERLLGGEHLEVAETLRGLGYTLEWQSRLREAVSHHSRALRIAESALSPNHPDLSTYVQALGEVHHRAGRYDESEELLERSLAIRESAFGRDGIWVSWTLSYLGRLYWTQGRYADAATAHSRALGIRQSELGPGHGQVTQSLHDLASVYGAQGRYAKATTLLERALDIYSATQGAKAPVVGYSLTTLAVLLGDQGRYAEAERLYQRAIDVWTSTVGPESHLTARALGNLAKDYLDQGRYEEAELLLLKALDIQESTLGREHREVAATLFHLGSLYRQQSRYAEAKRLLRRAVDTWQTASGADHPEVARALDELGRLLQQQERYREAEPLLARSHAIRRSALGPEHPRVAVSLYRMAWLRRDQGRYEEALGLLDRAIAILDSTLAFPAVRTAAYSLRARVRRGMGQMPASLDDLETGLRQVEAMRPQVSGGEETRAEFFGRYAADFDRMVRWQLETGDVETAFEWAERGRARVLLDQLAAGKVDLRRSIPESQRSSLEARERRAKARVAEYQQRITVLRGREDVSSAERLRRIELLQDSLRVAESQYRSVYQEIKNASPLWRDVLTSGGEPVALATVQRRLVPTDGLLLCYQLGEAGGRVFVIPPVGEPVEVLPLVVGEEEAALLGTQPGPLTSGALQRILGVDAAGDSAGGVFPALGVRADAVRVGKARNQTRLHGLFRALLPEGLWSRVAAASEVVVVPDGWLHRIPFAALVVEPGEDAPQTRYWLDEGPPIRYVASASTLYNLVQRPPTRSSAEPGGVLSLSDPIYDPSELPGAGSGKRREVAPDEQRDTTATERPFALTRDSYERAGGSLVRLPGTALETEAIRAAFRSELALGEVVVLQGPEANEPALRAELTDKRYLHLATHGLVDERRGALFAALALTPPPGATASPQNDGFLQLFEVYELRLPEAELAVLSACESNVGPAVESEGVFALSRGFLAAGARRVVASQWAVSDASTALLMRQFFERIAAAEARGERVNHARALHEAKRAVRGESAWADPYHWAPFVLTGK